MSAKQHHPSLLSYSLLCGLVYIQYSRWQYVQEVAAKTETARHVRMREGSHAAKSTGARASHVLENKLLLHREKVSGDVT